MRVSPGSCKGYKAVTPSQTLLNRSQLPVTPVRALSAEQSTGLSQRDTATYERVLRYPDGNERRIRYPVAQQAVAGPSGLGQPSDALRSYSEDWDPERWGVEWEAAGVWESSWARPGSRWARRQAEARQRRSDLAHSDQTQQSIPDSPAALARHVTSDGYREAQQQILREVRSSYEVLTCSPWVQSRTVHVVAVQHPGAEDAATYTLRTRVQRQDMSDELGKLIKRRRKDGRSVLRVDEIRDGVITFEDAADSESFFAQLPHAAAGPQYLLATCDSHQLFRMAQDTRAAVVLLRRGCKVPAPEQLSSSLLGSRPLEEYREDEDD
ncbi:hypothetical protein WJX84_010238 [Apatococcus fuscideae]|uniref:Uncharacterized protein n=1 Tax=Apatococcus fuscideae TaxID=2026836 RepID=A0AAW1TCX2_9CHLO